MEHNENSEDSEKIPPTQVKQTFGENRRKLIGDEIHMNCFKIPLYYCNEFTLREIIDKIVEEKQKIVSSQTSDADTSLSSSQIDSAEELSKQALKDMANMKQEKNIQKKLSIAIRTINESLNYFDYIPAENILVRDKRTVCIFIVIILYSELK